MWVQEWMDGCLPIPTPTALASPDWLSSSRLVSPSSSSSNFSLAIPCWFSLPTDPETQKDPEPPGPVKDSPNWVPVAVSSSLVVGFIGLLVTLLPPNPFFFFSNSPPPVASRLSEALLW